MQAEWQEESRIMLQGTSMMDSRIIVITQRATVDGGVLYQTITIKENPATQSENLSTALTFVPTPR